MGNFDQDYHSNGCDKSMFYVLCMHQEEDSKSLMDKERRKEALRYKLQRLGDSIVKTRKDREGKFSTYSFKLCIAITRYNLMEARTVTFTVTLIHLDGVKPGY